MIPHGSGGAAPPPPHDCRIVVLSVFFQQGAHFLYVQSSYTDLHTGKFRHDHLTVFGCYMHITGNMCP